MRRPGRTLWTNTNFRGKYIIYLYAAEAQSLRANRSSQHKVHDVSSLYKHGGDGCRRPIHHSLYKLTQLYIIQLWERLFIPQPKWLKAHSTDKNVIFKCLYLLSALAVHPHQPLKTLSRWCIRELFFNRWSHYLHSSRGTFVCSAASEQEARWSNASHRYLIFSCDLLFACRLKLG